MRTERILLITARADHGGGPRHLFDLLRALKSSSFEFFIARPNQKPYAEEFDLLCKGSIEIPARSFSLAKFCALRKFVKDNQIGVIHSHGRGAGLYSRLLGLTLLNVKVAHSFHGIHREPTLIGRIKMMIDRVLAFTPYFALLTSEAEKRDALEYSFLSDRTNSGVINNIVDRSRFKPRTAKAFEHQDPIRIGSILRADHAKGPEDFLMLATSKASAGVWTCVGATREELAKFGLVPRALDPVGRVSDPADWLTDLDVYVSTSRWEAHPLAVLEAMAAGCVCLLSDIPSHRFFAEANAALCFDSSSADSFQAALSRVTDDPSLRASLVNQAKRLVEDDHSVEIFRAKVEKVYRDLF